MTSQSEQLFKISKQIVPGGVHSPVRAFKSIGITPPFMKSADGPYLYDVDGKKYVDFCMAWGPLIFGHCDADIIETIHQAVNDGWSFGTTEPYSLELAQLITAHIPWVESIRFVNSGTEAVMSAIRLARAFTNRNMIIKFEGCYHGHSDGLLVKAGSGLAELSTPDSAGIPASIAQGTLVAKLNDLASIQTLFNKYANQIAGIIIEPLPANYGLLVQDQQFLDAVVAIAKEYQAVVIFDEVISGFRCRFKGMSDLSSQKPDLITYGKIIGGGFPVGAFGGRKEIMNLLAPNGAVYQAGTLSANALAMRVGVRTLQKLLKADPYKTLQQKTAAFAQIVNQKLSLVKHLHVRIQHYESIFWPVISKTQTDIIRSIYDIPSDHKELFKNLYIYLLSRGFYLAPSPYEVNFLSTRHDDQHLEQLADAIITYFNNL